MGGKRKRQRERKRRREEQTARCGIELIGDDLLQNVLSKLPASSFASAACVSRSWNALCNRILRRPKLSSAFSLNCSLQVAVKEVVDKVLSEPIHPHFALACVSPSFSLRLAHQLIKEKLGSRTVIISYKSKGIMGNNALTEEFKEMQWEMDHDPQVDNLSNNATHGILLTVGFVPGLKVDAIPLLRSVQDPRVPMLDKFVMDIREYTASVSGCTSPAGIIMFGDAEIDMKPVLNKLDYAMDSETFIVGDECCPFLYRGLADAGNTTRQKKSCAGVSLVLMRDRNKRCGTGDIQFHVAISAGMLPIGPTFKTAAVKDRSEESSTWLSATNGERREYLDGQSMLNDIEEEIGERIEYPVLYIGVTKRRKCFVGLEKPRWITSLAFHEVIGGDETYLFVHGGGIKTGDYFRFYHSDPGAALSSCRNVCESWKRMKQDLDVHADKKQVFGGIIFTCCGRGESFFGQTNVDSSPFLENFPGVSLAGTFCCGEIRRGSSSLYCDGDQEQSLVRCCLHPYSSVYLVMSHTPEQSED